MNKRNPSLIKILFLACALILIVAFGGGWALGYEPKSLALGVLGSSVASALFILYDFLIIKGGSRQENQFAKTVANQVGDRVNSRVDNLEKRIVGELDQIRDELKKK